MEPNETSENSSILSFEVTQERKQDVIYYFFAHNDWEFKEVQIMIKAGMIQVMEIILLSRITILMNACIVSVDRALQMREIDSFGGR